MNNDLTIEYTRKVLETFSAGQQRCGIVNIFKYGPGCYSRRIIKFIQAPDVSWNKPFKSMCTEKYDQWLAEEGIHNETEEGNLKALPRKLIVECILESWKSIPTESINQSFKSCAPNINVDGSEDDVIHCCKESQPFAADREMLKLQMEASRDLEDEANLFFVN